jgi:hypothetical protein
MMVQMQAIESEGPRCAQTRRWPLRTLAAFLYDGRARDEVQSVLAAGHGDARAMRLAYEPVHLSGDEVAAIEQSFPEARPERPLSLGEDTHVELLMPADRPVLAVEIRKEHARVHEAVERAHYLRFDYGAWADIWEARLRRADADELLADPKRRVDDDGEAELAARVVGEDDAVLRFVIPRPDAPAPWKDTVSGALA